MHSFYPGPSALNPGVPAFMQEACASGILSVNHRSPEFVALSVELKRLLQRKLRVPERYSVFFVSSATECWEIVAQSLVVRKSTHIYNGAFGEKWAQRTAQLGPQTARRPFPLQQAPDWEALELPLDSDVLCLTSCETSNGTQLRAEDFRQARARFPDGLIAVDATSSLGGLELPWEAADLWFASVQKCLGLPAGMALMLCSPEAIERAYALGREAQYNNVVSLFEQAQRHQTTHTPNVLGIFLLKRMLEEAEPIGEVGKKTEDRYQAWVSFLQGFESMRPMVRNGDVRSKTVLSVEAAPELVEKVKRLAKAEGFLLGNGYGEWKQSTFRIANFPSISGEAIEGLREFLARNFS